MEPSSHSDLTQRKSGQRTSRRIDQDTSMLNLVEAEGSTSISALKQ